jgi:hypothetical protein
MTDPKDPNSTEESEALAADLLDRATRMLKAIQAAGLDPFADSRNYLVIQCLGPAILRLTGVDGPDLERACQETAMLVQTLDLSALRG